MRTKVPWVIATVGLLAGAAASQESFSLDEVLSIPYPSQIATATAADRVVWVANERGVRNVWTATSKDRNPVRLTDYLEDDGQSLGGLVVRFDGAVAVYVRGGGRNRAGEHPNPTSDTAGAVQSVWAVSTDGGEPWKLGDGNAPRISPDGSRVLFSRSGAFHVMPLGTGPPDQAVDPEMLFEARGTSRSGVWSPDGSRLAFTSDRGDHSFVGVYDFEDDRIRWMSPGVDRDDRPAWSPDGRRVAFIRREGALRNEIFNFLISWPFRLLVADVESGDAVEIWESPANGGGFAQIYPAQPLRWVGDRLVFYSEHSGWMHIHSIPADGGEVVDLTPGACEAEDSDVDPIGGVLAFSHNCDEIDLRQISRVDIAGGTATRLTEASGIFVSPAFADSGARLFLRASGPRLPMRVAVAGTRGIQRLGGAEPGLTAALVEPEAVVFESADGLQIHGQLFTPSTPAETPRPAVIFMHGGPMRQMLLGWHYRGYYSHCYAFNQYLASRGWVVLSVNYRAGIGYGQAFRLAADQGPYGASEYEDILAGARLLAARDDVDARRMALWGGSYGGYLTALGLARNSDVFAGGVDLHGVHDWSFRATDFTEGGGWGLQGDEAMELARESSPVASVEDWTSPVLMVHGDDDRNVLFQQTTDLVQRLRRRGVEPQLLVLPDEVHGFLRHESWLRVFTTAAEFLRREVRERD